MKTGSTGTEQPAPVHSIHWFDQRVELQLDPTVQGRLVFVENYDRGWKAYVNGQKRPIEHEDIFMSVKLSRGEKDVVSIMSLDTSGWDLFRLEW